MARYKLSDPCPFCGSRKEEFRDQLSRKEKTISGMCQRCQNNFFDTLEPPEPDFGLWQEPANRRWF